MAPIIIIGLILSAISRILSGIFNYLIPVDKNFKYNNYFYKSITNKLIELEWVQLEGPEIEKKVQMAYKKSVRGIFDLVNIQTDSVAAVASLVTVFITANFAWWIYILIILKEIPSLIFVSKRITAQYKLEDDLFPQFNRYNSIESYFRDPSKLLEIKTTHSHRRLIEERKDVSNYLYSTLHDFGKNKVLPSGLIGIFETLVSQGINIYYFIDTIMGRMSIGSLQFYIRALDSLSSSVYRVLSQVNKIAESYKSIQYAYSLFCMKPKQIPSGDLPVTNEFNIEFKNVWFKYKGLKSYALKNINISIRDNDRLAIVGENGAGKSTFLKLLMRVYEPTKGEILLNGKPIGEYSKEEYQKKISLLSQTYAHFNSLTVAENITVYDLKQNIDNDRMIKSAKLAEAFEFIDKFENKFDTILTKTYKGGVEISEGQWQKVALARQFYGNRPMVILDEPTSSIDPLSEARIFQNLYDHVKEKTVIVVSHRYNTVRAAKHIIVIDNGEIIEKGTHDELIKLGGKYSEAYKVQSTVKKI